MKKWLSFFIIVLLLLLLMVCCNRRTVYPLSQDYKDIVRIEIVEIDNYRIVSKGYFDMIKSVVTLNAADYDSFLSEFHDVPCQKSLGPSQECIEGRAVRFTYSDGAFELISAESGFYCSANRDWSYPAYYFDYNQFNSFISSVILEQSRIQ